MFAIFCKFLIVQNFNVFSSFKDDTLQISKFTINKCSPDKYENQIYSQLLEKKEFILLVIKDGNY